jgi:hypothetical protein
MPVRGKHFIGVSVRRISIEIEYRVPFHNPLNLLRKLRPDNTVMADNPLPFLAMILFVAGEGRALLFIACRMTEPSKGSVHKALEHSALLSGREPCCLSTIY